MGQLCLYLLGGHHVTLDGEPVTGFRSDKVRALLAFLAVEVGAPHRREALAGLLWPELPDETARRNLRLSLHRLRDALDDGGADSTYFEITRESIGFRPARAWVDVTALAALLDDSENHAHRHVATCRACVARLAEASALYRGDFLQGFSLSDSLPFSEWTVLTREWLHRRALWAFTHLTAHHRMRGELEQAEGYARRQLDLEPWGEAAHRQLMEILALKGESGAALAQYERCRHVLAAEFQVAPDYETEALLERILSARSGPHHNLPPQPTSLVGRAEELNRVAELLSDPTCRLLTILGPGGIGKTRLAIQAALEMAAEGRRRFLHGVTYVPLADIADAAGLIPAVAATLGLSFREGAAPDDQVIQYLDGRQMLLVLDNLEHLLEGTPFLQALLAGTREVKLLVTSRQRLNLTWEWSLTLGGLPYPDEDAQLPDLVGFEAYDAVRMFQVCARRVRPAFALDDGMAPAVARICRAVEGMPLGVELAAAWVAALPLPEIAAALDHFQELPVTAAADVPERHRSLNGVFEHTWDRLGPSEREALAQMSVFRGGFGREAAEKIAGSSPVVLKALVDRSLLRLTPSGRYEIHGLLRHFAAEKLAAEPANASQARRRHGNYFIALLERAGRGFDGGDAAVALNDIKADIENIREAWRWAATQGGAVALERGLPGLCGYYRLAGPFQEGERQLEMAVAGLRTKIDRDAVTTPEATCTLARLLVEQARFLNQQGLYEQAVAAARQAAERAGACGAAGPEAAAYLQWGQALWPRGEYAMAQVRLGEALARARAASLPDVEADSLRHLGIVRWSLADYVPARELFEAALEVYRENGDRRGAGATLNNLGLVLWNQGDTAGSRVFYEQALEIHRETEDRQREGSVRANLSSLETYLGHYTEALAHAEKARRIFQGLGDRRAEGLALGNLGLLLNLQGDFSRARWQYEQGMRIFQEIGDRRHQATTWSNLGLLAHRQGENRAARECSQRALELAGELGDRFLQGYALTHLGHALLELGRFTDAAEAYREAVAVRRESGERVLVLESVAGLARVASAKDDLSRAQRHVEEILAHLASGTLDGAVEPLRIFLTCYRVLAEAGDGRAPALLDTAHDLLQARADKISDAAMRRSFLEKIAVHREILEEYHARASTKA